jgi:SPP1 family predicted phage head-tail adaptor
MKIQKGVLHISASNMRESLALNDIVFVKDANYEMNSTNLAIKTIFAAVEELQGSRILELSSVTYQKVYKIYCRYDTAITLNSTFTYKGNLLKIHAINNLSQLNRYFEILAYTDV